MEYTLEGLRLILDFGHKATGAMALAVLLALILCWQFAHGIISEAGGERAHHRYPEHYFLVIFIVAIALLVSFVLFAVVLPNVDNLFFIFAFILAYGAGIAAMRYSLRNWLRKVFSNDPRHENKRPLEFTYCDQELIMSSDNVAGMVTQHKILDDKVNAVYSVLKNTSGVGDIKDTLDDLVRLLQTHCAEEENLMRRYRYNGLEGHERTHENLLSKLLSLREKVSVSPNDENKEALVEFLKVDLLQHATEDMKAWQEGKIGREFVFQRLQDPARDSAHGP